MPEPPSDRHAGPVRTVVLDGSPESVAPLTEALAAALDGGPPVRPVAKIEAGLTPSASQSRPDPGGVGTLLVETSGSTGGARVVVLPGGALVASARATHARLGGPGRWLLALPAHHVAGAQVIVRALLAGHSPAVLDTRGGFRPERFAAAARALPGERRYTSLVPTQLHRILAEGASALEALRGFDAVLVGGAATPPTLLATARDAGVTVITTYGMSETAGGCVYDGLPLDGVRVRLAGDGRIELAGPMVASGYLDDPAATAAAFERAWFRTRDLGDWDGHRLTVLGRADDVITSGGESVHPAAVERVLTAQPDVRAACVVGLPDQEWGHLVAAAIVVVDTVRNTALDDTVRDTALGTTAGTAASRPDPLAWFGAVRAELGPASVPRRVRVVDALPLRGVGKPDRAAVARLLSETSPPCGRDTV